MCIFCVLRYVYMYIYVYLKRTNNLCKKTSMWLWGEVGSQTPSVPQGCPSFSLNTPRNHKKKGTPEGANSQGVDQANRVCPWLGSISPRESVQRSQENICGRNPYHCVLKWDLLERHHRMQSGTAKLLEGNNFL